MRSVAAFEHEACHDWGGVAEGVWSVGSAWWHSVVCGAGGLRREMADGASGAMRIDGASRRRAAGSTAPIDVSVEARAVIEHRNPRVYVQNLGYRVSWQDLKVREGGLGVPGRLGGVAAGGCLRVVVGVVRLSCFCESRTTSKTAEKLSLPTSCAT